MTDINGPEQERKDAIPGIVQGIFLFCGILEAVESLTGMITLEVLKGVQ